jgi:protein tyrosine/serine phosphatase
MSALFAAVRSILRWRRLRIALPLCLVAGLAAYGAYAGYLRLTGNFHEVVAGELYRSAQPDRALIDRAVARYGIRTVVNLRGASPGTRWYDEERNEAQRLGLRLVDVQMHERRMLTAEQARHIVATLRDAPKPILIHCRGGADRTGLVAALYLAGVKGAGEEAAEAQLSMAYGHLPIPEIGAYAMDATFEMMEPAFGYVGS